MTFDDFLQWVLWLARKIAGSAVIVALLALLYKLGIPLAAKGLLWLLALFGLKISLETGAFLVVLVLIVALAILLWLDSGMPFVTPGCTLTRYRIKPDRCATTTCAQTCIALTGPYPRWMGTWALARQDVGCICPAGGLGGLAPWLQKLLDQALSIQDIAQVRRELEQLIPTDGDNPLIGVLQRILEKIERGEPLTDEDREAIRRAIEGR